MNIQMTPTIMVANCLLRNKYVRNINNNNMIKTSLISTKLFATKKTGTFFKSLPNVYPSTIHYNRALKSIRNVKHDPNIKNARNLNRKFSAQSLDALMKSLTIPISQLIFAYQNKIKELHPYEVNNNNDNIKALKYIIYIVYHR